MCTVIVKVYKNNSIQLINNQKSKPFTNKFIVHQFTTLRYTKPLPSPLFMSPQFDNRIPSPFIVPEFTSNKIKQSDPFTNSSFIELHSPFQDKRGSHPIPIACLIVVLALYYSVCTVLGRAPVGSIFFSRLRCSVSSISLHCRDCMCQNSLVRG